MSSQRQLSTVLIDSKMIYREVMETLIRLFVYFNDSFVVVFLGVVGLPRFDPVKLNSGCPTSSDSWRFLEPEKKIRTTAHGSAAAFYFKLQLIVLKIDAEFEHDLQK